MTPLTTTEMPHTPNDRTHRRRTDRHRRDAYARDDRRPAPSASAGWRKEYRYQGVLTSAHDSDDRAVFEPVVLPDGSGVPEHDVAEEYLPHLADNIANARLDGVDRETVADALEHVADGVRAGRYDPDRQADSTDAGVFSE